MNPMIRRWRLDFAYGADQLDRRIDCEVDADSEASAKALVLAEMRRRGASMASFDDMMARLLDAKFGPVISTAPTPFGWRPPTEIPQRQWLYGRQLQRGLVHLTAAPGVVGKTSYRVGTALALASGRALLGETVWDGPKRAWLWNLEDSPVHIERLVHAACIHHGLDPDDIGDRLHVDTALGGRPLRLGTMTDDGLVIDADLVDGLIGQLRAARIDYLNVDPFVSAHGGIENDNGAMDQIVKAWAQVAYGADCAIDLTMHTGKLAGAEVTTEAVRGAKSITDAARSVIVLNRMTEDEAKRYGVQSLDRRAYFRVHDDKPNHAPSTSRPSWFRFVSVDLGNGGLAGGDSIGVVEAWQAVQVDPMEGVADDTLAQVQTAIAGGEWRESSQASAWAGRTVAEVMGLDIEDKAVRVRIAGMLRLWIKDGALKVVERRDSKQARDVKFIEVGKPASPASPEVRKGEESEALATP